MNIFESLERRNHDAVLFCSDKDTGLRAIIAIHDTTLGPALGGCRMKPYASVDDALADVLKLSRAMSYKASIAGLNLGGGKSVVMLDSPAQKTPELLKAFAERIALLKGSYIGAGDVGSDTSDLRIMKQYCPSIVGLEKADGGLGDSAILTALGVFVGIKASVKEQLGRDDLDGVRVSVQGAGKVGYHLVGHLLEAGCKVTIADVNEAAVKHVQEGFPAVSTTTVEALYGVEADVFSPNAIGGLITADIAKKLPAKILAGGANNPLAEEDVAKLLHDRGILYAPDFVINGGGLIMVSCELEKHSFEEATRKTEGIYQRTLDVFEFAKKRNLLPWDAAYTMAMERIDTARKNKTPVPC